MNIGYITPNFYPDMVGGIEWYSLNITRELARLGHEVHVFTQLTEKARGAEETKDNINIHRIKSYGFFYRVKFWPSLIKSLKKYKLDVIISLDYAQTQTWTAGRYCSKKNIPFTVLLYDIQSQKKPRVLYKQIFLDIFDKLFAKRILQRTDKILIRTKAVLPWLTRQGISKEKIFETPCGLTEEELQPGNRENFEAKYGFKGKVVMYMGRIRKQKGIFLLLRAFKNIEKQAPGAKLVYIGPDEKEYDGLEFSSQLKNKIAEYNFEDVHVLDPIYSRQKNDALSACDVLVLPSSYEAFGQVFLQAMAQGKPVIGTNAGGAPYVIDHEKDGFIIEPWNQKELEHYIVKLLKNKSLQKKMGAAGKEKVKLYRYSELATKLEKILRR
jgi:glycosyltransferase involved in cell wall biosynthesis